MNGSRLFRYSLALVLAVTLAGCGGSTSVVTNPSQANRTGTVAVFGTDAPMGSVLAFQVNATGLTASDGTNTANLFSGSQTIEFSRLNGLRTLLDLQTVPAGTYTIYTIPTGGTWQLILSKKTGPWGIPFRGRPTTSAARR